MHGRGPRVHERARPGRADPARRGLARASSSSGYLERIERLDPQLDSFLTVAADQARVAAASDAEQLPRARRRRRRRRSSACRSRSRTSPTPRASGRRTAPPRTPTAFPTLDDEVVARIRRAGFVILGKTNTPEFGSRSDHREPGLPDRAQPVGHRAARPAGRRAARARASPPGSARSRTAPTAAGRSASRRRGAGSWG